MFAFFLADFYEVLPIRHRASYPILLSKPGHPQIHKVNLCPILYYVCQTFLLHDIIQKLLRVKKREKVMRILQHIYNCGGCPNKVYDSGGTYNCSLTDERILDESRISEFCPLAFFPAKEISKLQHTLVLHQKSESELALSTVVMRNLSAVLNTPLSNFACLVLKTKPNKNWPEEIVINREYITNVDLRSNEVHFNYEGRKYRVYGHKKSPVRRVR